MAINLEHEPILSLSEAAKALPALDGKRPHASTIFRWMTSGCRGIRLEHVRIGRRIGTTAQALSRFMNDLADAGVRKRAAAVRPSPRPNSISRRSDAQREKAVAEARAELRRAGVRIGA